MKIITAITLAALFSCYAPFPVRADQFDKGSHAETSNYEWRSDASRGGPIVIIASLSDQLLQVYRNGVRIGRATISSGEAGHETPIGIFSVLEKNRDHRSNLFHEAHMPYMERLTWSGVAMHAGKLPGYPASHGCVRLPLDFARKLYAVTSEGSTVIITNYPFETEKIRSPGVLSVADSDFLPPRGVTSWNPSKAPAGPLAIIISSADGEAYVYQSGREIGSSPFSGIQNLRGLYIYSALSKAFPGGRHDWLQIASFVGFPPQMKDLFKPGRVDQQFIARIRGLVTPGTVLILTDEPVDASRGEGFKMDLFTTMTGIGKK